VKPGTDASQYATFVRGGTTEVTLDNVTALGEGSSHSYGLYNEGGATVTLRGGSFRGQGGNLASGIRNSVGATLEAANIAALGEDASTQNRGLDNYTDATATVTQSVLEGSSNSVLLATGTITVSNSRLVGSPVFGTVTCVLVTRGTTVSTDGSTCP
jgi:hypothetical protein